MANKIVVTNPVVEIDGDEMTRIIWKKIREEARSVVVKEGLILTRVYS
jgi:Isocitrate dehydrogenases